MKNKEIIDLILKRINNKFPYFLSHPICIDDENLSEIYKCDDGYYIASKTWEIDLKELTNRELYKVYKLIKNK